MTIVIILILGCLAGFVVGRQRSIGLGLIAGVLVLGAGLVATGRATDTPAIFVALMASLAVALGVNARQRIRSRSAHPR
jgi:hypothetical protein